MVISKDGCCSKCGWTHPKHTTSYALGLCCGFNCDREAFERGRLWLRQNKRKKFDGEGGWKHVGHEAAGHVPPEQLPLQGRRQQGRWRKYPPNNKDKDKEQADVSMGNADFVDTPNAQQLLQSLKQLMPNQHELIEQLDAEAKTEVQAVHEQAQQVPKSYGALFQGIEARLANAQQKKVEQAQAVEAANNHLNEQIDKQRQIDNDIEELEQQLQAAAKDVANEHDQSRTAQAHAPQTQQEDESTLRSHLKNLLNNTNVDYDNGKDLFDSLYALVNSAPAPPPQPSARVGGEPLNKRGRADDNIPGTTSLPRRSSSMGASPMLRPSPQPTASTGTFGASRPMGRDRLSEATPYHRPAAGSHGGYPGHG